MSPHLCSNSYPTLPGLSSPSSTTPRRPSSCSPRKIRGGAKRCCSRYIPYLATSCCLTSHIRGRAQCRQKLGLVGCRQSVMILTRLLSPVFYAIRRQLKTMSSWKMCCGPTSMESCRTSNPGSPSLSVSASTVTLCWSKSCPSRQVQFKRPPFKLSTCTNAP